MEPIIHQARNHGFGEGWLAALHAMGVAKNSLLWNPNQIPYPVPPPPVQSQVDIEDEEDTSSIRDFMQAIDSYVEMVNLEALSNIHGEAEDAQNQTPLMAPPTKDMPFQPASQTPPPNPAARRLNSRFPPFPFSFLFFYF